MAQLIAAKDMTIGGHKVKAGHPIPAEGIRSLPRGRLQALIEQRRVSEDSIRVSGKKER